MVFPPKVVEEPVIVQYPFCWGGNLVPSKAKNKLNDSTSSQVETLGLGTPA